MPRSYTFFTLGQLFTLRPDFPLFFHYRYQHIKLLKAFRKRFVFSKFYVLIKLFGRFKYFSLDICRHNNFDGTRFIPLSLHGVQKQGPIAKAKGDIIKLFE